MVEKNDGIEPYLLNSKDSAKFLGISEGYLRRLRCSGLGPKYVKLSKGSSKSGIRYRVKDLVKYADSMLV